MNKLYIKDPSTFSFLKFTCVDGKRSCPYSIDFAVDGKRYMLHQEEYGGAALYRKFVDQNGRYELDRITGFHGYLYDYMYTTNMKRAKSGTTNKQINTDAFLGFMICKGVFAIE